MAYQYYSDISDIADEHLVFPFGTLDAEKVVDTTILDLEEPINEIKFGDEEFERLLKIEYFDTQVPLLTDEEYEAERLENIEYQQAEKDGNGLYYDDEDSNDEFVDNSYMYYD